MARDQGLEELVWYHLSGEPGLSERPMFGGRVWLVDGHLLCGARHDGLLVRLGKDRDGWAVALPDVRPMMMSPERPMRGWVRAGPDAFGHDDLRQRLLNAGLAFVRSLPPKPTDAGR
jgi:hypothetical protein